LPFSSEPSLPSTLEAKLLTLTIWSEHPRPLLAIMISCHHQLASFWQKVEIQRTSSIRLRKLSATMVICQQLPVSLKKKHVTPMTAQILNKFSRIMRESQLLLDSLRPTRRTLQTAHHPKRSSPTTRGSQLPLALASTRHRACLSTRTSALTRTTAQLPNKYSLTTRKSAPQLDSSSWALAPHQESMVPVSLALISEQPMARMNKSNWIELVKTTCDIQFLVQRGTNRLF